MISRGEQILLKRARDLGIRASLVENSERSQSALELMAEARREHEREQQQEQNK